MTCDGCGRAETLLDGHYCGPLREPQRTTTTSSACRCGFCSGKIAEAVREGLDDTDVVDVDIVHATYVNENERLTIELVRKDDD